MQIEQIREDYTITTDKNKMDVTAIHDYLSGQSYWSKNIPFDIFKKSFDNSLTFGLLHSGKQIGFARVITDYATFAYLADVYVLEEHRGQGLSKWMMEIIMSHPELQNLRRWVLLTKDTHELYKKFGWKELPNPDKYMELHNPNVYNDQH